MVLFCSRFAAHAPHAGRRWSPPCCGGLMSWEGEGCKQVVAVLCDGAKPAGWLRMSRAMVRWDRAHVPSRAVGCAWKWDWGGGEGLDLCRAPDRGGSGQRSPLQQPCAGKGGVREARVGADGPLGGSHRVQVRGQTGLQCGRENVRTQTLYHRTAGEA